ncbi:MAG: hypothetical protein RLZZ301_110 [Bacteroidota bacterium]|jgi:hypothetical protein
MSDITKHIVRFLLFVFLQAMILNQLNIGYGIHLMAHPLFIMLLPFEMGVISLMSIAFLMGVIIDVFSNTFGLYTTSLVLMAYVRPVVFKFYGPREGYDPLKEPTAHDMGTRWYATVFGILLAVHHFWFFFIEIFQFNRFFFILQKTILSGVLSFVLCLLLQSFLINRPKKS